MIIHLKRRPLQLAGTHNLYLCHDQKSQRKSLCELLWSLTTRPQLNSRCPDKMTRDRLSLFPSKTHVDPRLLNKVSHGGKQCHRTKDTFVTHRETLRPLLFQLSTVLIFPCSSRFTAMSTENTRITCKCTKFSKLFYNY